MEAFPKKKSKGFQRQSMQTRVNDLDQSLSDVIEGSFQVKLTPDNKFLCNACAWNVTALGKASRAKVTSSQQLKLRSSGISCLSKKIKLRSPAATPRKAKRARKVKFVECINYIKVERGILKQGGDIIF